jgi:hypothetical protein
VDRGGLGIIFIFVLVEVLAFVDVLIDVVVDVVIVDGVGVFARLIARFVLDLF